MKILFYPEEITENSKMHKLCVEYGINYHNDPNKPYDLHIFWSRTRSAIIPDQITLNSKNVINRGCFDITKRKVNDIFDDIELDPTTHVGKCVEKLDLQALHTYHSIIKCPAPKRREVARFKKDGEYVEVEGRYIYQKLIIDKEGDLYIRYRIYYAGGITHIVKIYQEDPFKTVISKCELVPTRRIYSESKELDLNKKCKEFGFDLGELDIILMDGNPIVIDVNNVVGGGNVPTLTDTDFAQDIKKATYEYLKSRSAKNKD